MPNHSKDGGGLINEKYPKNSSTGRKRSSRKRAISSYSDLHSDSSSSHVCNNLLGKTMEIALFWHFYGSLFSDIVCAVLVF